MAIRNLPYPGTSVDHVSLEVQVSAKYLQSSSDQVIDHAMYIVYLLCFDHTFLRI